MSIGQLTNPQILCLQLFTLLMDEEDPLLQ